LLRLEGGGPDADLAVSTTSADTFVAVVNADGGDTSVATTNTLQAVELMSVVDDVNEATCLGTEGANFAIRPSRNNHATVLGEGDTVAFQNADLDAKKLGTSASVPDANVSLGASGEKFGVAVREDDTVDTLIVASLTKLLLEGVSVEVVDVALLSADEVVFIESSDRGDTTVNLELLHDGEIDLGEKGNVATTATNENIAVSIQRGVQNTTREFLDGTDHFVVVGIAELNANDVTAGGANVGISVSSFNHDGAEFTTDVSDIDVSGEDLAVLNIDGPNAEDTVSTRDESGGGVVQEGEAE
jgi:hypothetical protein